MSVTKDAIKHNYNMMHLMDYLSENIGDAGFSTADVDAKPTGTNITVHVTRPGLVIGRKGEGIRKLTEGIAEKFDFKEPRISVKENTKPELSPTVMCNRVKSHIQRGTAFRRAIMWTMRQIMAGGAKGVQVTTSGKLRGDRSAFEKHTVGILPRAGYFAELVVDEDIVHVETPMGLIGIRIRIAKDDVYNSLESFELISKKAEKEEIKIKKAEEEKINPKDAQDATKGTTKAVQGTTTKSNGDEKK